MTVFDWILLSISIPWMLLNIISIAHAAFTLPPGVWEITYRAYLPFLLLLWVAYRVWG